MSSFSSSLEVSQNTLFRRNFNFTDHYLINNINDNNKKQTKECDRCLYSNVCSGIWDEYIPLQKLSPVGYIRDFFLNFRENTFAYKMRDSHEYLKNIFDKNIRQLIIPSSLGEKETIYAILRQATKLGFYKITLLIDDDFVLEEDIFHTGVNNIQGDISSFSLEFSQKVLAFSHKHAPQFRIDIDLFVFSKLKNNSLKELIRYLPSPFLKIYFIYDYRKKNREVLLYKDFIERLKTTESMHAINFSPISN
jgi:hypothetical protein